MKDSGIVDCHLHIIDHGRYPFRPGVGYTPRPDETGTREALAAMLDAHGVAHALLVQPSGYGFDNSAMLDAMAAAPGRYKAIAVISGEESDRELQALADRGVVGLRFNLVNFDPAALAGRRHGAACWRASRPWIGLPRSSPGTSNGRRQARCFGKAASRSWSIISASAISPPASRRPASRPCSSSGAAAGPRSSSPPPSELAAWPDRLGELDGHVEALLAAFGKERCVWGSDWPFLGLSRDIRYGDALAALDRWLPDAADRDLVLRRNPARLFGFAA